jgi:hypothetical protein
MPSETIVRKPPFCTQGVLRVPLPSARKGYSEYRRDSLGYPSLLPRTRSTLVGDSAQAPSHAGHSAHPYLPRKDQPVAAQMEHVVTRCGSTRTHTRTHTDKCARANTHTHKCARARAHTHTHTHTHTQQMRAHTHTDTRTHTHTQVCVCVCVCVCLCICVHLSMYVFLHVRVHLYIPIDI